MTRLFRLVAIFFLAFAAHDLVGPGVCAEELVGFPPPALVVAADDEAPAAPAEPQEEDCFCCCSHLLVQPVTVVPGPESEPTTSVRSRLRLLTSPPHAPFRPPRAV